MACRHCHHTMHFICAPRVGESIYHCPRCGTLKCEDEEVKPEYVVWTIPANRDELLQAAKAWIEEWNTRPKIVLYADGHAQEIMERLHKAVARVEEKSDD